MRPPPAGPPGGYGPRPGTVDEEKTPVQPHAKPVARVATPLGLGPPPAPSTLARLGRVDPDPFPVNEAPTPTVTTARVLLANKHIRLFAQLPAEDAQLVHAFAVRLLAGRGR